MIQSTHECEEPRMSDDRLAEIQGGLMSDLRYNTKANEPVRVICAELRRARAAEDANYVIISQGQAKYEAERMLKNDAVAEAERWKELYSLQCQHTDVLMQDFPHLEPGCDRDD